jgi:anti-sigma factor NepR-like protein
MRREYPREGDERLSAKPAGKSKGTRRKDGSGKPPRSSKKSRPSELGRALRSVYDDTLRETVPDEFLTLLGKLS